jgi:hypothetical protein
MSKSFPQSLSPEAELTRNLLTPGQSYPWNPAEPEAESYYLLQEEQFTLSDWSEADIQRSAASFFTQLHSYWPDTATSLVDQLRQKFATRIPQEWLDQVAATVTQMVSQQATTANQLVSCVQDLLPTWEEADLLVIARPYAYAMRSEPDTENIDNLARAIDWQELSEMEQAKLTMLVTKYALDRLADQADD